MNTRILEHLALLPACGLLLLAACGGDSAPGVTGNAMPALADAVPASSADCSAGAMSIRIGLDANADGALQDAEVSHTQVVCTGGGEAGWLVGFADEPAGANCAAGGQRALVGRDANEDGVLQPGESTSSAYLCNGREGVPGVPGSQGPTGDDGATSLLAVSAEPPGANCANGGSRVQGGLDLDRDGALAPGEATRTAFVCDPPPAGLDWRSADADTLALANTGYFVTAAGEITLTLPDDPAVGSVLRVNGTGLGSWRIAQRAGQSVRTGALPLAARWTGPWMERFPANTSWSAIASSADGRKLVAGNGNDALYTSTDFGASWTRRIAIGFPLKAVSSTDGTVLAVGMGSTGVRVSRDSGATWSAPASSERWHVAMSADGNRVTAAVDGGQLQRSIDAGRTFAPVATAASWRAAAMSADGRFQVAGPRNGQLQVSTDFGQTWAARASGAFDWTDLAVSADGSRMVGVSFNGPIVVSADFGATWLARGDVMRWITLAMSADGRTLVAGPNDNTLRVSEDFGATWQVREPTLRNWIGLACSADCGRVAGAVASSPLLFSPRSTFGGGAHGLVGEPDAAVELQYLGGGAWTVVHATGGVMAW